ncbi:MAG: FAD-dependent oxidoreductase [Lysobacter sp.]|nr:FAD-dependent oxidoreductase [Lysobacter sp.]
MHVDPKKAALLVLMSTASLALYFGALDEYLQLQKMQSLLGDAHAYTAAHPVTAILGFAAIYVCTTALSIPGAVILSLFAGALFGVRIGSVVVLLSATIGATLAMLSARYVFSDMVHEKFGERMKTIDAGMEREGGFYLFALRLVPIFPFFVINLAMGLTSIGVWRYVWVSMLGMLPATIAFVYAGRELGNLHSGSDILNLPMTDAFTVLGLVPLVARKIIATVRARRAYRGWKRPKRFDRNLIVIGAGAAGLVTSHIAATVRAKVTLIEKAQMGGDCLNRGCVPSKALLRAAHAAAEVDRAPAFGIPAQRGMPDFGQVMARVRAAIAAIEPNDSVERYTALGVEVLQGEARIVSPWEVEVNGQRLSARHLVIATGARPFVPPIPGLDRVPYCTSDTFWTLETLPHRIVVLGGGPVGCELAQCLARFDCDVSIVEMAPQLLAREDADAAAVVQASLERDGIRVLLGRTAVQARAGEPNQLAIEHEGTRSELPFDLLLVAVGRSANVDGFGLETLGIPLRANRTIETDDHLRTRFPNIFAVGDVTGPYQLTHAGAHQAWYAAVNALFGRFKSFRADYRVLPAATYTDPELARVGINEREAKARKIAVEVIIHPFSALDRAIAEGATEGFVKVLVPPGKDTILGATVVGARAGDLIAIFALAMKQKIGLDKILGTVFAYPTFAEAAKFAAGTRRMRHAPAWALAWLQRYHTLERRDWKRK